MVNGDAQPKSFSLLQKPSGVLALAPIYDVMCTLIYGDDRLAMYVDNVRRTNQLTAQRIVNEARRWGLPATQCEEAVADILDRAPAAISAARDETAEVPDSMVGAVQHQLAQLWSG